MWAQPSAVDPDLVYALVGIDDPSALAVGTAPEPFRAFFRPGADVLGTVTHSRVTRAVAHVRSTPSEAQTAYAGWVPEGWTPLPEPTQAEPTFGFVSDRGPRDGFAFSKGETLAFVTFSPAVGGGSVMSVTQRAPWLYETLTFDRDAKADPIERFAERMPVFRSPSGGAAAGGRRWWERRLSGGRGATLDSGLPLAEVVAHYDQTLAAEGWSAVGTAIDDRHAVSAWMRSDEGVLLTLTFRAERGDDGTYALRAAMVGPDS